MVSLCETVGEEEEKGDILPMHSTTPVNMVAGESRAAASSRFFQAQRVKSYNVQLRRDSLFSRGGMTIDLLLWVVS